MPVMAGGNTILGHGDEAYARAPTSNPQTQRGRLLRAEVKASASGFRQGVLNIDLNRAADQALTGWDGNPDCGLKITAQNRADQTAGVGGERGIDVQARNRGTNINWVNAANFNARNDTTGTASSLTGVSINCENYGPVNDSILGLDVLITDENSGGSHTKHGIHIRIADTGSTGGAADAAIKVSHTGTLGFTAFAELAAAGDGYAAAGNAVSSGTTEALVVKIGANLRYIPCYAAATF